MTTDQQIESAFVANQEVSKADIIALFKSIRDDAESGLSLDGNGDLALTGDIELENASPEIRLIDSDNGFQSRIYNTNGNQYYETSSVNRHHVFVNGHLRALGLSFNDGTDILEDYETAAWSPAFTSVGGAVYSVRDGLATRIDDFVFVSFEVTWSAITLAGDSSGIGLGTLPFSIATDGAVMGQIDPLDSTGFDFDANDTIVVGSLGSSLNFFDMSGFILRYSTGQMNTSGTLSGFFIYRTDD